MIYYTGDRVVIRSHDEFTGRKGVITSITLGAPPPYQVDIGEAYSPWLLEEHLMLQCDCELWCGCTCGAAKRERVAEVTE